VKLWSSFYLSRIKNKVEAIFVVVICIAIIHKALMVILYMSTTAIFIVVMFRVLSVVIFTTVIITSLLSTHD